MCKDVNQELFYPTCYANLGFEMGETFCAHSAPQCRIPINSKSNKQGSVQIYLIITTGKLSLNSFGIVLFRS